MLHIYTVLAEFPLSAELSYCRTEFPKPTWILYNYFVTGKDVKSRIFHSWRYTTHIYLDLHYSTSEQTFYVQQNGPSLYRYKHTSTAVRTENEPACTHYTGWGDESWTAFCGPAAAVWGLWAERLVKSARRPSLRCYKYGGGGGRPSITMLYRWPPTHR